MSSPNINSWYYVKLTLKSKADGTTTKTLRLSNRPLVDEADGATVYYPILKSISNIGSEAGDTIPIAVSGSIVLDDSPGSFGFDRKFSDLTERWQLIGGTISIYSANTAADDISITGDFNLNWTSEIVRATKSGDEFNISVSERGLSQNTMLFQIPSSGMIHYYGTTTVVSSAVGKYLPLIFGNNNYVAAILIQSTNYVYAYATTIGSQFTNGGVQAYYCKDSNQEYQEIRSATDPAVAVYSQTSSSTTFGYGGSPIASWLQHTQSTDNYLVTKVEVKYLGTAPAGAYDGIATVKIYEGIGNSSANGPGKLLATSSVDVTPYAASFSAGTDFYIPFYFNEPVVLSGQRGFWISTDHKPKSGPTTVSAMANYSAGYHTYSTWYITNNTWHNFGASVGGHRHVFKFYGARFNDHPTGYTLDINSDGLAYSWFDCETQTAIDLSKLSIIIKVNGVKDDGGVITGTGTVFTRPDHILRALDWKWNGAGWAITNAQLDYTAYSGTFDTSASGYPRAIKGFISQRASVAQIMDLVCQNSAFKIVRYNGASKSFTIYGWGYRQATQAVITDEDAKVLGIEYLGSETIVNIADINYDRSLLNFNPIQNFDNTSIYNYSSKYTKATAGPFSSLSTISDLLFSKRELNNTGFDLLSPDSATYIDSMAQYFMGVYAYPHVYVTIEVPLFKYRTLDLLQVVDILHPSLPAYFGSNPDAADPYYAAGGAANDILDGEYLKQAQRYRAQIESKTLNYNLGDFPTMILKCRLLINPNDPT